MFTHHLSRCRIFAKILSGSSLDTSIFSKKQNPPRAKCSYRYLLRFCDCFSPTAVKRILIKYNAHHLRLEESLQYIGICQSETHQKWTSYLSSACFYFQLIELQVHKCVKFFIDTDWSVDILLLRWRYSSASQLMDGTFLKYWHINLIVFFYKLCPKKLRSYCSTLLSALQSLLWFQNSGLLLKYTDIPLYVSFKDINIMSWTSKWTTAIDRKIIEK